MKTVVFLILLTIASALTQDTFPPCYWTAAQWTTFKQCVGTQTNEIIAKCIRQQTSAKDWNTVKNAICSNQSQKDRVSSKSVFFSFFHLWK